MHHMDQTKFKTKAISAKIASGKQGSDVQGMQLPEIMQSWAINEAIEDAVIDAEKAANRS